MTGQPPAPPAESAPATIFLGGPDMRGYILPQMYPAYQDAARFQVVSLAAEWDDIQRQVRQYRPEALVIEASVAPGPDPLRDFLGQLVGTVAIVILPAAWAKFQGQFQGVQTSVRGVHLAPVNWAAVASATYSVVATERARTVTASPAASLHAAQGLGGPGPTAVVGTRTIAFTSFAGGTGKSTLAEALALDLARQHIKTLLCSFNSPAAAVGHMGQNLHFSPNATEWLNRPTVDGFLASLQHPRGLDDLDLLLAPDDPHMLARAGGRPADEPNSIRNLIFAAYSFNYGAILLDLPPFADSMWALQGLLAANAALLVCRPTLHDQFAAIHAYRLLGEQLATQVRIPPDAIFAVLNFTSSEDSINARSFQGDIAKVIGRFPPILETFPYIASLPRLQSQGDSPVLAAGCEAFSQAARSLSSKLVTRPAHLDGGDARGQRTGTLLGRLLGVTVRLGGSAVEPLIATLAALAAFLLGYDLLYRRRLLQLLAAGRLEAALTPPEALLTADPRSLEYRLAAAGLPADNPRLTWLALAWLPAVAAALIGLGLGFPIAVAGGAAVVAWVAPRRWLDGQVKQRGRRMDEALPTAYTRLGAILRASPDVAGALGEVAASLEFGRGPTPLSAELRQTALEAASGEIGREAALRRLQRRAASTSLANLGLLLERFEQTGAGDGGRFYAAFDTAAQNVQGILEARQRAQAKAAEQLQAARIVPVLLAGTMLFFMHDPGFKLAFQVPVVQAALGAAVALMYFGYTIMADIAREAV